MATKTAAKKSSATKKSAAGPAKKATAAKVTGGTSASKSTAKKATKSASKVESKPSAKKTTKRASSKRELIAPNGDKRLIRRDSQGRIKESDDLGKSLSQDVRKASKTVVNSGQGDRGDQKKKPARKPE